jgi:predicted ABC-type transport system involved in lysophospholipase L1 biosynthesis ATPase subunit
MERPDRGSVTFAGEDVWRLSDRRRSRLLGSEIGLVERAAPHLDVPVLTGVALPLLDRHGRRGAYARAKSALAYVGASECARQRWGELADSERALVALAHGIAREPRLLLVDDLAATLGIEERAAIAELLGALAAERGVAVLLCAGDSGPTPTCDRVASLGGGELLVSPATPASGTNVLDFPGRQRRRAYS